MSVDEYGDAVERSGKLVDVSGRVPDAVTGAMAPFDSRDEDCERGMAEGSGWMSSPNGLPPRAFERHLVTGTAAAAAARVAENRSVGAQHVAISVTDDRLIDQFARLTAALPAAGVPTEH